jgi:hypothetical protein
MMQMTIMLPTMNRASDELRIGQTSPDARRDAATNQSPSEAL